MTRLDYLPGTSLELEQPEDLYHFNSDTAMLGQFLSLKHSDTVLDIGCNTGALLLYASLQKPHSLSGIDLYPRQIETAQQNLNRYGIQAELSVCRLQDYVHTPFDALIVNPPYFKTADSDEIRQNDYIKAARHEFSLPLGELMKCSEQLLKDNGRLYVVYRASRLIELLQEAERVHLHAVRMQISYESQIGSGRSIAIQFRKGPQGDIRMEPPLFLSQR